MRDGLMAVTRMLLAQQRTQTRPSWQIAIEHDGITERVGESRRLYRANALLRSMHLSVRLGATWTPQSCRPSPSLDHVFPGVCRRAGSPFRVMRDSRDTVSSAGMWANAPCPGETTRGSSFPWRIAAEGRCPLLKACAAVAGLEKTTH